jgi:hypothetical protein
MEEFLLVGYALIYNADLIFQQGNQAGIVFLRILWRMQKNE